ncbi:sugar ABC transporter ATP-binding protein [Dactylosporangium sp. CA-092794]|uniref:sugar ABC transporter ATP-binding protein n=1 Tax=Dactylosporangium sp. CA-092794 TaxID=3239929 RepID=UPI003D8FE7C8
MNGRRELLAPLDPDAAPATPRLALAHASKTYGSSRVLSDVGLELAPGEIHALVGQNGSGKSTLVRILSGVIAPDPGATLEVNGQKLDLPTRPTQLNRHGLSFVHQDLGLIEDATVVENIRMGRLRRHRLTRRIDWRTEVAEAAATLQRLRSAIDPRARLGDLRPGQRALVAIARALQSHESGGGCIVFDESTQSLPRESLPEFYEIVKVLAAEGTSVLVVSHRLEEVLLLADRVTVLQDGQARASGIETGGMTEAALARLLLGREVELADLPPRPVGPGTDRPALSARGVSGGGLTGLDLDLKPGQVLGVTGATDAGHEVLAAALAGARSDVTGIVRTGARQRGLDLARSAVRDHIAAGIAYVPEQRAHEGLALAMTALENVTLPRLRRHANPFAIGKGWQRREFAEIVGLLGITPPAADLPAASFSGGNQQKLLLGKWLLNRPDVLLLHEPTQAVDVGARVDILRVVRAVADAGTAVLICSVEATDLAYVCDDVIVLRAGQEHRRLTGRFTAADVLDAL